MTSPTSRGVHCFASIRKRNCIGKEEDEELPKVPLRFKQDENGLDERLATPGINWNGFVKLRNQIFQSFTESLEGTLVKKASSRNLSISRQSLGTVRERYSVQLYAATAKTPSLRRTVRRIPSEQSRDVVSSVIDLTRSEAKQASPLTGLLPGTPAEPPPRLDLCAMTVIRSPASPLENQSSTDKKLGQPTLEEKMENCLADASESQRDMVSSVIDLTRSEAKQASPPTGLLPGTPVEPPPRLDLCATTVIRSRASLLENQSSTDKKLGQPTLEEKMETCLADASESQRDMVSSVINLTCSEAANQPSNRLESTTTGQCNACMDNSHQSSSSPNEILETGEEDKLIPFPNPPSSSGSQSTRPTFLQAWNQMKYSKHYLRKQDLKIPQAKSFLPPTAARNSPHRIALERQQRKEDMEARLAKKREEEEKRRLQLQAKREQERLDKIRKQEEKRRRVAEKQAALEKQVAEKKEKLAQVQSMVDQKKEMLIQKKAQEKEERNRRQRERMVAAEQRRKKEEEAKRIRLQKLEEERRILEETYKKRLEYEEEERQRKKQEKLDQDRERQRQKELERKKKEEAEEKALRAKQAAEEVRMDHFKKPVKDSTECQQMLLQWKQLQEEKKARLVGITKSNEGHSSDIKEEPSTDTTPPAEASGTTLCGHTLENAIATTAQANGTVTPACTKKRSSKYADIPSYELTPAHKDSLAMADNDYDIANLSSGDSTDDEDCPKKSVPKWAASASIFQLMREQEKNLESNKIDVGGIFPPEQLLCQPELARIFKEKRRRFFKRSSSAHWVSPMLKKFRPSSDSA